MKNALCTTLGIVGGAICAAFGGWDHSLAALLIFMAADYISGLVLAGVFHKSTKSESGALESRAGFKGLVRKGMTLLIVLIGAQLDMFLGLHYIRDTVIIGFMTNELISIIENAGLMGIPMPDVLKKAIEILQNKRNDKNDKGEDDK